MKVLIVRKSDAGGGAFYAAYRLHNGLRNVGVDSKMLVDHKMTDDPDVCGSNGEIGRSWSRVRSFVDKSPLRLNRSNVQDFHPAWVGKNIAKHQLVKEADIINLHWITRGFISIKQIAELAKLNKNGTVSFENVVTFNMDEYVNLPEDHPESYHSFMNTYLFSHVDIKKENVHMLSC